MVPKAKKIPYITKIVWVHPRTTSYFIIHRKTNEVSKKFIEIVTKMCDVISA